MTETSETRRGLSLEAVLVAALFLLMGLVGAWYGWGNWRAPELASSHGAGIDRMMAFLVLCTGLMFLVGHLVLAWLVWRAGRSDRVTSRLASPRTEKMLSVSLGLLMAIVAEGGVLAIGMPVWGEYFAAEIPEDAVQVEITSQQFVWNVRYPGEDGVYGAVDPHLIDDVTNPIGRNLDDPAGQDDVFTINTITVPVDRPVRVRLRSKDVIHSFFLPHFRVKQDAVPGMTVEIFFTPTREGTFPIACTELCGMAHYRMQGVFRVVSEPEYEAWLQEQAG